MKPVENGLAHLKGMPIKKATSFEPSEIKGDKPNIKLSADGQGLKMATTKGKINQ
jgi:hypothetical protein